VNAPAAADAASDIGSDAEYLLICKIDSAKTISDVLSAINFPKKQALCRISQNGLRFTVDESHLLQANAFLKASLFQDFVCNGQADFNICIKDILECLTIFGASASNTSLRLHYQQEGRPLCLILEDSGVMIECSIKTLEPMDPLDFHFLSVAVPNTAIIQSEALRDALSELEWAAADVDVTMSVGSHPHLSLSAVGVHGTCEIVFPQHSDVFTSFAFTKAITNRYKYALLFKAFKALSLSKESSIRMNENGVLGFQHMIRGEEGQVTFVEFFICALETEEV